MSTVLTIARCICGARVAADIGRILVSTTFTAGWSRIEASWSRGCGCIPDVVSSVDVEGSSLISSAVESCSGW